MSATNPIIWFELQIAPAVLRLAILPGQPILFGCEAGTWLVSGKECPEAAAAIGSGVGKLIATHLTVKRAPHEPERCFQTEALKLPSFHLRMAWKDGKRWATHYAISDIPPEMQAFADACRKLGLRTTATLTARPISGDEALRQVREN